MALMIPSKPGRNARSDRPALAKSEALKKAIDRITIVAGNESRKDDKVQRAALQAIAETINDWFAGMAESDPMVVEDLFVGLGVLATAPNRGRIFRHAMIPAGVKARVEAELARIKEAQEKAEAEKAKAAAKAEQAAKGKSETVVG